MKFIAMLCIAPLVESHPTRGAWIEIAGYNGEYTTAIVAPHTGCVD